MEIPKNLMDFSDCVLVEIFKFLDSTDLYHLSRVNTRLETLMTDILLWKKIDARSGKIDKEKNDYCLDRLGILTRVFCIRGKFSSCPFGKFTERLKILALENQVLDGKKITLNDFPKSLEELSFKNSRILNSLEFFRRTSEQMINLKVLLLDGCELLNCSVVMSLSKYINLRILSFYKCEIGNSISYFSIAAWHGFKKVEILDVRLSGLGNSFLRSMIRCPSLKRLYFQNMDTSYVWDLRKKCEENRKKSKKRRQEEADNEQDFEKELANEESLVTDRGTFELKRMVGEVNERLLDELEGSYLYKDPYGTCRCGGTGGERGTDVDDADAVLLERRYPIRAYRSLLDVQAGNDIRRPKEVNVWCQLVRNRDDGSRISPRDGSWNKRKHINNVTGSSSSSSSDLEDSKSKRKKEEDFSSSSTPHRSSITRGIPNFFCCTKKTTSDFDAPSRSGMGNSGTSSTSTRDVAHESDSSSDEQDAAVITVDFVQNNAVRNLNFGFNGFEIVNLAADPGPATTSTLRRLSFRGHSTITDAALPNLENLRLDLLDVTHTGVTTLGLDAFRKTNPQCRILHKNFCVCRPLYHE